MLSYCNLPCPIFSQELVHAVDDLAAKVELRIILNAVDTHPLKARSWLPLQDEESPARLRFSRKLRRTFLIGIGPTDLQLVIIDRIDAPVDLLGPCTTQVDLLGLLARVQPADHLFRSQPWVLDRHLVAVEDDSHLLQIVPVSLLTILLRDDDFPRALHRLLERKPSLTGRGTHDLVLSAGSLAAVLSWFPPRIAAHAGRC